MKRPPLPTVALAPSCGRHDPTGTAAYCPACAMARIDRDRALNPEPRVKRVRRRPSTAAAVATITFLIALAVGLDAIAFLIQGAPTWHH